MAWPTFTIVCTDADQHRQRIIDIFTAQPNGTWVGDPSELGESWTEWDRQVEHNRTHFVRARENAHDRGSRTWRFPCPSCKRDVRITDKRLAEIVLGLRKLGVNEYDISRR